jgi:hypothetical protein
VLTNHYQWSILSVVPRELSGQVEIVPGVVGPEVIRDRRTFPVRDHAFTGKVVFRFAPALGRYICDEFTARGVVTTEALRLVVIGDWLNADLLRTTPSDDAVPIQVVDNPDNREPWGLTVQEDVAAGGPTDRALRWIAHLYRYGYAVSYNPTKAVQELLTIPRSTAGRWIAAAREAGYLGPSEAIGKAGG